MVLPACFGGPEHSIADPFPPVLGEHREPGGLHILLGAAGHFPFVSLWKRKERQLPGMGQMLGALCLPKYTQGLAWG